MPEETAPGGERPAASRSAARRRPQRGFRSLLDAALNDLVESSPLASTPAPAPPPALAIPQVAATVRAPEATPVAEPPSDVPVAVATPVRTPRRRGPAVPTAGATLPAAAASPRPPAPPRDGARARRTDAAAPAAPGTPPEPPVRAAPRSRRGSVPPIAVGPGPAETSTLDALVGTSPAAPRTPDLPAPTLGLEAPPPPSSPLLGGAAEVVEAADLREEATGLLREQVRVLREERDSLRRRSPGGAGWSWRDLDTPEEVPETLAGLLSLAASLREEVERLRLLQRGDRVEPMSRDEAERVLAAPEPKPTVTPSGTAATVAAALDEEAEYRAPVWALALLAVSVALCVAGIVLLLHH